MKIVNLKLAKHKTKAVLITSRNQEETMSVIVGDHEIKSQPFLRYQGVTTDARLKYKTQVADVGTAL